MSREESIKDLEDILKEGDELEVEVPSKDKSEDKEKENDLEVEVELEGKELEEEFDKEKLEGKEKERTEEIPQYKEITKKYPDLFKDFPNLRHAFFHAKEYRELFPTVEDAREALEKLDGFSELESSLTSGKSEDVSKVLSSIKDLSNDALSNLSTNFLSSIKKIDNDLYYQVITPELVNFTRVMFNAGLRNENDNLKNAALVAALHFFGDQKVASGEKEVKLPESKITESKENDELKRAQASFRQERYTTLYNDVVNTADSLLSKHVLNGLDPKEEMTDGIKELVSEKVMKEITKTLASNAQHTSRMDSLWKKAAKDNFSNSWRNKIVSAYLEAAKEIMPKVRARVRASTLGIRDRQPENTGGIERRAKRIEPNSTSGGGQRQSNSLDGGKNLDPKKIDWNKTSDLDIIRGTITPKNS